MSLPNPPKPKSRADRVPLWRYAQLFRKDILSAQPARLYRAWMAEFRTPFFRSYLVNQPDLVRRVLDGSDAEFPKSERIGEGLRPLLGNSVFVTNGDIWRRQRRIIDPAFEGGRLRNSFPAVCAAADASAARLAARADGTPLDIEAETSHATADVIFRAMFSVSIADDIAAEVFEAFQAYQRSQPILNLAALVPLPSWMPRPHRRATRDAARRIRDLIGQMTHARLRLIEAGTAPDDLATKIMTTPDPETGQMFDADEMIDQVAIFFLAGHETSASALAWTLCLLALDPEVQERCAAEARDVSLDGFSDLSGLKLIRDVFREALRLYPPVPMMVRETRTGVRFRERDLAPGAQIVLSPWHLHRHERLWEAPDAFDPDRWHTENGQRCQREAYVPFSAGPRVCPGAGFAMMEGVVILARLLAAYRFAPDPQRPAEPVAHLTVRGRDGIWLGVTRRDGSAVAEVP